MHHSQLMIVLRVLSQQVQIIKVTSELLGIILSQMGASTRESRQNRSPVGSEGPNFEQMQRPWTWCVLRCSGSDTRDCGDILVRHLVKAQHQMVKWFRERVEVDGNAIQMKTLDPLTLRCFDFSCYAYRQTSWRTSPGL